MSTTTLRRHAAPGLSRGEGIVPPPPSGIIEDLLVLRDIVRTLRKRPLWILAGLLLGLLVGLLVAAKEPTLYRATARVLIANSKANRLRFNARTLAAGSTQLADEAVRIKSDPNLNQLIDDLDLMNGRAGTLAGPAVRAALLRRLRSSIAVTIVPDTSILSITFVGPDSRFSARLVNQLVKDYIDHSFQEHFDTAQRRAQWPASQLAQLKAEVQATQVQMNAVQQRLGNTGFASEYNRQDTRLDALTRNAVEARTLRDQAREQYDRLLAMAPADRDAALDTLPDPQSPAAGRSPRLAVRPTPQTDDAATLQNADARVQLELARASLAQLSQTLGPNNPQRKSLEAEVGSLETFFAQTRARRLADLRARLLLAQRNAQASDAGLSDALARAYGEGGDTLLYRKLLREFTFTRALYVDLYTRLRTALINAGLGSSQIQVLDTAQVTTRPLPSYAWAIVLGCTTAGLLLGCIVALARENFRRGLRSIDEVEAVTDLPSLAALPRVTVSGGKHLERLSTARRNLTAIEQPSAPFTEALRLLRLNLDLSGPGAQPRYILFTSSTPSEGKTTVAGNYAVVLAERGERVLLIDADMHRPNLHHRFGLSGQRGLSTVLSNHCTWRDAVQPVPEVAGLDLLVAGPVPPSPAALIAGPQMLSLLRQAGRVYTHIVLDSPPVMAVNDGIMLSQLVDAVVFVIRHGKIDKRIVRLGRERLSRSGAPLAGIVLNGLVLTEEAHQKPAA